MNQLGNILEALRFAGDQLKDTKLDTGILGLHHAIETVNILWHIGKVEDQRILMAAALHQIPRIQDELRAGIQDVFGNDVSQYIESALDPESLKSPYLERLSFKKNVKEQAGRQIYLAATAALLRHHRENEDDLKRVQESEEIQTRKEFIKTFSGTQSILEEFLKTLLGESQA